MKLQELISEIKKKKSFLCIGLDPDLAKLPKHLLEMKDPIFEFNKAIIDSTSDLCVSYKPNTAFYEAHGVKGWQSLEKTINYINQNYPEIFTIADAKRGDIGNTSSMYAKAFLQDLNFDAVTVAPYMGKDSVEPFLAFENKFTILLALTSNAGASDFQMGEEPLFEKVIKTSQQYKNANNLMYVVGATQTAQLKKIREIAPKTFFLIPGVGAQGGNLADVCDTALTDEVSILVNSSRGIIYASSGEDFAHAARNEAQKLQSEVADILQKRNII